jgi:membrane-bound lytic murein transglycosylase D
MKRYLAFAACLLSLQIVEAGTPAITDSSLHVTRGFYTGKTAKDSTLTAPFNAYANSVYKLRLDSIQKDIHLDYNEYVQNYIDIYTRHKDEMSHVLGLAKYYFPIYEKIFREAGIPPEIKYLSIVESKLDPSAVSRVGATGPWQFMSTTARIYGLNMDGYTDERRDPVRASYAAAAYLKDAYQEFGDWLLAIASYNCGKSNVEHAIAKAGAMDFWSIRPYLPAETRGYVPAYIAISYVMNYAQKHNIPTENVSFSIKNDTVVVDKFISLASIAKAINTDITNVMILNPVYTRQIVNGTVAAPRKLVIPCADKRYYSALYDVLNAGNIPVILQPSAPVNVNPPADSKSSQIKRPDFRKVKKGETLIDIAADYGLDVSDIKEWNHLHTNKVVAGQRLKLNPDAAPDSSLMKDDFVTYKVKRGDTLSEISAKFEASAEKIREMNGLKHDHLQPGMTLKISKG